MDELIEALLKAEFEAGMENAAPAAGAETGDGDSTEALDSEKEDK